MTWDSKSGYRLFSVLKFGEPVDPLLRRLLFCHNNIKVHLIKYRRLWLFLYTQTQNLLQNRHLSIEHFISRSLKYESLGVGRKLAGISRQDNIEIEVTCVFSDNQSYPLRFYSKVPTLLTTNSIHLYDLYNTFVKEGRHLLSLILRPLSRCRMGEVSREEPGPEVSYRVVS